MIIQNKGLKIENFYLPPFKLKKGELVVIYLYGGAHYYDLKTKFVRFFSQKTECTDIENFKPLTYVQNYMEPKLRKLFYPISIKEYLNKNANEKSIFSTKIYDEEDIIESTPVNKLTSYQRKLLALYSALSKSTDIVFDLDGLDPQSAIKIYNLVKEVIEKGGSAICIDWTDEMKDNCTKFITIEV